VIKEENMDRMRVMSNSSIKNRLDSFFIREDFIYSYSKANDRVTLEMYDFNEMKKTILVNSTSASKTFPGIWELTTLQAMELILATYDSKNVTKEPIVI
jgi:hypothetical protein